MCVCPAMRFVKLSSVHCGLKFCIVIGDGPHNAQGNICAVTPSKAKGHRSSWVLYLPIRNF